MLFRGLLVALSGFLFIFSPTVPIRTLAGSIRLGGRRLLFWGMGVWLLALLPSLFLQSILRQVAGIGAEEASGRPWLTLTGALLSALFLQGLSFIVLWRRLRRERAPDLAADGLSLGFGIGLVAQVFTGLNLVGAGFRLAFGSTEGPTLAGLAETPLAALAASMLAMILYRVALLTVHASLGLVVARAVAGLKRLFFLALGLDALFAWAIVALQLAIGAENPGLVLAGDTELPAALLGLIYYVAAAALAFLWLRNRSNLTAPVRPTAAGGSPTGARKRARKNRGRRDR